MNWQFPVYFLMSCLLSAAFVTILDGVSQPISWVARYWIVVGACLSLLIVPTMLINPRVLLYLLPTLPLIGRAALILVFLPQMKQQMNDEESNPQEHRNLILTLAGFSFSAVLALLAYGSSSGTDILLPVFYVFIGFIAYLFALNVQAYKATRWQDQAGSAAVEVGTLCLVLCVIAMFFLLKLPSTYRALIIGLPAAVFLTDHAIRLTIWARFLGLIKEQAK